MIVLASAVAASLVSATNVFADKPVPQLTLDFQLGYQEESARPGEPIEAAAYLVDPSGNPIPDAEVSLTMDTVFMNVPDQVSVGTAVTDERGLARFFYEPRTEGENLATARFTGDEVFAAAKATDELLVAPGPQVYQEVSPLRLPGTNVWMVTGILGAVWGLYAIAVGFMWMIERAEEEGETGGG